jgi:hypothetical protein
MSDQVQVVIEGEGVLNSLLAVTPRGFLVNILFFYSLSFIYMCLMCLVCME